MTKASHQACSDNDVVVFAKEQFPRIQFNHMKRHDVDENFRMYRFGDDSDDDLLHLLVDNEGSFLAYGPNQSGGMKNIGTGKITQ